MISPAIQQKEDIRIPDSYKVTFYPIIGNPVIFEVASHCYINAPTKYLMNDKGHFAISETGEMIPIEWSPLRGIELKLVDRRTIPIFPEHGRLEFSDEWDKIVELHNLIKKEKLGVK